MDSYQIGRIEGRWSNFLPPIQGGKFRRYGASESIVEQEDGMETPSSSQTSSLTSSPLFDAVDRRTTAVDGQRGSSKTSELHALSSVSSFSSLDDHQKCQQPQLSHLDALSRTEIDLDLAKYPPLDPDTQDQIVQKYRELDDRIRAEGLYNCNYTAYLIELTRYCLLFSLSLLCLKAGWYGSSGLFLGLFWHQLVFTAHDAGHMGITHRFTTDTVIGIVIADFLGGLSLGWWKRNHNVHHLVTNAPEHDPDIAHMPFFAISHRFLASLRSTYYDRLMPYDPVAQYALRIQHHTYYPLLALGRFNLYRLSWEYLLRGLGPRHGIARWHRWLELVGQAFFWAWFGYGILYRSIPTTSARLLFILVSHMATAPLHVQITLSHFAMSTADLGPHESFPQKMLRTTMDVDCPAWLDFLHGGLQFQAVHHLFPRIPRHNLRKAQRLVRAFCAEVGIPYAVFGFVEGNREVLGKLGEVGRQAAVWAECQRRVAGKGVGDGREWPCH